MKKLQVMEHFDTPARGYNESASERKKQRKRKKQLREFRKRMFRILTLLFVLLLLCMVALGGKIFLQKYLGKNSAGIQNVNSAMEVFETQEPLVVLDAGHGGSDQGTSSGKMIEKDINLKVANLVKKELKKNGVRVLLTREDDRRVKLADRAAFANEKKASLFVSIHCNYNEDSSKPEGMEFYYQKGSARGKAAAEALSGSFDEVKDVVNRGTREEDFYVLRETNMPAVLVELGFLSNASDRKKLNEKDYQKLLAEHIARTIMESELITGVSDEADTK